MELFLKTLLALSLGGSLMAVLLYGLKLLLGQRLSSTVYYYMWLLVLLRFVLPLPGFMPAGLDEAPAPAVENAAVEPAPDTRDIIRPYGAPRLGTTAGADAPLIPPTLQPAGAGTEKAAEPEQSFSIAMPKTETLIFALWAAGMVFCLLRPAIGYLRFSRALRREAVSPEHWEYECYRAMHNGHKPGLIKSLHVSTPMLMGVFRPCLVLPDREYTEDILRNIFLHELKHYSRRDLLYKWCVLTALSLHWFNPLTYLIRREINRACEMSCDEMLIASMDRDERQSYGETLISLAARRPLPAGIVATSFAMEKRDLKERLSKIMKYKKRKTSIIAALLAVLLLVGCGAAAGPKTEETAPTPQSIVVSQEEAPIVDEGLSIILANNVDELLAAIGSDRIIYLASGVFDLTEAEGYAKESGENWFWQECYDGFELVICNVENMQLIGKENTEIVTRPRYADVLSFEGCSGIGLEALTLGHSIEDGFCTGGVLYLDSCNDVNIKGSSLYGCGTVGIQATNCEGLYAMDCEIYDCSSYGVNAVSCRDVVIENSKLHSNKDGYFQSIFRAESCEGFTVLNCEIYDNEAQNLLRSAYSKQVSMLGCTVKDNLFTNSIIHALGYSPVIDQCSIADTDRFLLYGDLPAMDSEGNELTRTDFEAMEQSEASYEGMVEAAPVELQESVNEAGLREVSVSTVDEFLAAIGDNTVIKLEGELFDLSTASDYGSYGGDNYYWVDIFDGPSLVINGVENLSIVGEGCTIAAIPRYANVLSFINCERISLSGFTAGHTEEPGQCAGGVLDFQNCWGIDIADCRLYGCGILGISASFCSELKVQDTEIYDCSQGAISLTNIFDASFENMDIHDCHAPEISIHQSMNIIFEGDELAAGVYTLENGKAREFIWPAPSPEA